LIKSIPPKDPQKNPSDFHSKMFTKLEVLEQSLLEESKLEFLNPISKLTSPPLTREPKLNPSKCITNNLLKLFQETMSVSISKILPSKKSKEEMLPLMPPETHPEKLKLSLLKLLS